MFEFFKKPTGTAKKKFDRSTLRKNNISLLILDERWNNLFNNTERTPDIIVCEEKLRELLKTQSRLITESKDIAHRKKNHMDRIIKLTPEAFDRNSEEARNEMHSCEVEIRKINDRMKEIEEELDNLPDLIKEANIDLLEKTVSLVYYKIRLNQKRVAELEVMIEETKAMLKEYIDEKESLSKDDNDIYSYFHDLLGPEELEKLDIEFFED